MNNIVEVHEIKRSHTHPSSKNIPKTSSAIHLLRRVRDFAQIKGDGKIDKPILKAGKKFHIMRTKS